MFMYVAHLFLIFQPLSVGTFVLLRHQDGRKGCKHTKRWNGPYKIVESLGKGVYKIFNLKTRKVVKKAVNICKLKLFYSGEQKKSLHFSDNSIFQTCSPSITGNLSTHELPNVSNQDPISHRSCQAFKRPMKIESSIEDVGILDSACLPGSSCNESKMSIPDCLAVGNVGFLRISGEEIAPVDTSNSHSTTVIGEDLNSVLSMFNRALQNA